MEVLCKRCNRYPVVKGRKKCINCLEYEAVAQYKYWCNLSPEAKQRKYNLMNKAQARRIKERREQGICTRCGKNKADKGYVSCTKCRIKWREHSRRQRNLND